MKNRHGDTPEINNLTYYIFEEIEKRGLQFCIPEQWRPLYRTFLRERNRRFKVAKASGSESTRYSEDFGDKGTASSKENPKTD